MAGPPLSVSTPRAATGTTSALLESTALRRFGTNAAAIAILAFLASIGAHGVGWITLDAIPRSPTAAPHARVSSMTFVEMPPLPDEPSTPPPVPPPDTEVEPQPAPTPTRPTMRAPRLIRRPVPPPPDEPVAVPETPPPPVPVPETPPPPPTPPDERQAVEQESDDPNVEPPPDARFLADQNRRVDEETQATETSVRSDATTAVPPPPDESIAEANDEPEPGADAPPTEPDVEVAESTRTGALVGPRRGPETPSTAPETTPDPGGARAGAPSAPSAPSGGPPEQAFESITIDDGFGSFTITRPRIARPEGGAPSAPGVGGHAHGGHGTGPRLDVGYAGFEALYGRETLAEERAARRATREAAASAGAERREERWQQYRFAAENFLPAIRPGNQTALNAAASPFASFLAGMHRDIHVEFAEGFLMRIEGSRGPLANLELYAEMQLVLAEDGRVLSIAIARTSGVSAFDLGAIGAVMDAQPFDPPPDAIKSGDGRVYLIWGFARDPLHACHVTQSRPYILPNPPPLRVMPGVATDGGPTAGEGAPPVGPFRRPAGVLRLTPDAP